MKKSAIKSKKLTLHECKRELFLFAQSIKNIADRLEQDAMTYHTHFPIYTVVELRNKASLILERL